MSSFLIVIFKCEELTTMTVIRETKKGKKDFFLVLPDVVKVHEVSGNVRSKAGRGKRPPNCQGHKGIQILLPSLVYVQLLLLGQMFMPFDTPYCL